jgi:uncharacterized membrane protein
MPAIPVSVVAVALGTSGASGQDFLVIPKPAGSSYFSLADISTDGTTIVGTVSYSGAPSRAFRWTQQTGVFWLGLMNGGTFTYASGVSGDGSVVVGSGDSAGLTRAFRWTNDAGFQPLPTPPGAAGSVYGTLVSIDGSVASGQWSDNGTTRAWRWTAFGGTTPLPGTGYPEGMSDDGSIIVGIDQAPLSLSRWSGDVQDRYALPNGYTGQPISLRLSGNGAVAVGSMYVNQFQPDWRPFRWSATEGFRVLSTYPMSLANAVSFDASVIVGRAGAAVAWTANRGEVNLQQYAVSLGLALQGRTLDSAQLVSPNGRFIVGVHNSSGDGWVLRLPAGFGCYANCDGSTAAPALNIADFSCFLQRFAAGEAYGNCDASTASPVLNVQDFSCFLQKFAAGCP